MAMTVAEKQEYAKNHLLYEVEMVAGLVDRFRRFAALLPTIGPDPTPAQREVLDLVGRNADIEAFAVHARNLVEFLYGSKKGAKDCVAADYFTKTDGWGTVRPRKPAVLTSIKPRIGVEVVHLSYGREHPAFPWDYDAIWAGLSSVLALFAASADEEVLGSETRAEIARFAAQDPDRRSAGATGAALTSVISSTSASPTTLWQPKVWHVGPTGTSGPTRATDSMPGTAIAPPARPQPYEE